MVYTTQAEPEHRFSGAYDPDKYAGKFEQETPAECPCGAPFQSFKYHFDGEDHCLNCALDAAGIERRLVRP